MIISEILNPRVEDMLYLLKVLFWSAQQKINKLQIKNNQLKQHIELKISKKRFT